MGDAARLHCTTVPQLHDLAQARGWTVEAPDPHYFPSEADAQATTLRIHIQPPMPFAKQPGVGVRFDTNGCLTR